MSSCPIFSVTTSGTSEYLIRRSLEIFAYGNWSTHNRARLRNSSVHFSHRYFFSRTVLSLTHSENAGWLSFSAKMAICFRIAIMWLVMRQIDRYVIKELTNWLGNKDLDSVCQSKRQRSLKYLRTILCIRKPINPLDIRAVYPNSQTMVRNESLSFRQ